jgi:hypothetical protein
MITYCALISISPEITRIYCQICRLYSTHLIRTPFNPLFRVRLRDATTNLHAALPRLQCFLGGSIVSGTKHYDVCAGQAVLFVEVGVECGGVFGGPVRLEHIGRCGVERAADDLLDITGV